MERQNFGLFECFQVLIFLLIKALTLKECCVCVVLVLRFLRFSTI